MAIKKKIEAFTLAEILVVIVISTIVVGLALSVLNLVQQNFYSISQNYRNTTENQHLKQQLAIDFNRFHSIHLNKATHEIIFKNPIDSVLYVVRDEIVIRQADTIGLGLKEVAFYYEGRKVYEGKIDAIKLYTGNLETAYLFVSKLNDAKNVFKESWELR